MSASTLWDDDSAGNQSSLIAVVASPAPWVDSDGDTRWRHPRQLWRQWLLACLHYGAGAASRLRSATYRSTINQRAVVAYGTGEFRRSVPLSDVETFSLGLAVVLSRCACACACQRDLTYLEDAIEETTDTPVSWTRNGGSCAPQGDGGMVMGYYRSSTKEITMCQNRSVSTELSTHSFTRAGMPCRTDALVALFYLTLKLEGLLTPADRRNIRKFYPVEQHRAEGEARAVANYYDTDPEGYARFIREALLPLSSSAKRNYWAFLPVFILLRIVPSRCQRPPIGLCPGKKTSRRSRDA